MTGTNQMSGHRDMTESANSILSKLKTLEKEALLSREKYT